MKKISQLFALLIIIAIFSGCVKTPEQTPGSPAPEKTPVGDKAVSQSEDPAAAFEAFVQAIKDKNYKAAWDLMSEESRSQFMEQGQPSFSKFQKEVEKGLENPETAEEITSAVPASVKITAELTIKSKRGNEEKEDKIKMVKEQGKWKLNIR